MAENSFLQDMAELDDDRPLAVRRKRRLSSGPPASSTLPEAQKSEDNDEQPVSAAKTPTKRKKRVRFSEPTAKATNRSSSTGLTPYFKRTSFSTYEDRGSNFQTSAVGLRRLSLPVQLSTSLPSPSLSSPPMPFSGEIQFQPLRQILDARLKRRLKRNGLSEELNEIEAHQKEKLKWEQEIRGLKDQLTVAKHRSNEEHSDERIVETGSQRVRELEGQIEEVKRQTREQATTARSKQAHVKWNQQEPSDIDIFVDNNDDMEYLTMPSPCEDEDLRDTAPVEAPAAVNEVAIQASLPSLAHTEALREARLSLEYLFPGEITLGLTLEDPEPLLDTMLDRMRDLKAQVLLAEDSLSTTKAQESNLRNQFNAVLAQLDRARTYAETIRTTNINEKSRADTSQARVQMLESTVQAAASKVQELEKGTDEKDRSIQKLQDALGTYRVEVGKLESLIVRMEGEYKTAMTGLRAEMDEAVADLECHVVAETRGRREAEQEVVERDEKIKQLKCQEEELTNALNEKQQIIRETERIFEEERLGREREVGGLNVHIGQLSTELSESNAKVLNAEEKERSLMRKLQEERDAGLRAVECVQAELARCEEKAEHVKTSYVSDAQRRGAEVTQHQGLLTPVSATRFKDVEGYVEVRRGKGKGKKRDSGIVILEEDEDTVMADDL